MPKVSYNRILDEHLHTLISQGNHEALERLKRRAFTVITTWNYAL